MDSPTLTVNIVNPYNYYGEAVYEDFTMYIPYPNFKNKVDILKDIRYVLLHNEYDPDEDENSDKWFICNIVSSCYTTKLKDPKYDDEYDKLKGDFIGEFAIPDNDNIVHFIGVGVDLLVGIEAPEEDRIEVFC